MSKHAPPPWYRDEDLLTVLKRTLSCLKELHGQGIECPECEEDFRDGCVLLRQIEAAIVKADGRDRRAR
jgi:hypothetical protein